MVTLEAPITLALGNNVRCKTGKTPKIQIKVNGDNFKDINAITLTLRFKTESLRIEEIIPALTMPEGLFYNVLPIDDVYSEFRAAWSSLTPFSLKNTNDIFCIYATFLGTPTDLVWITENGNCEFAAIRDGQVVVLEQNPPENYYVNGFLTNI